MALAVVLGLGTVWILDGLEVTIVGAIASRLQEKEALGLAASQIGVAGTFYIVGAAIGALTFGHLTDRLGASGCSWRRSRSTSWPPCSRLRLGRASFWAFRFLTGLGIGGEYAAINSAIDELIPARVRGWVDLAINGSFWLGRGGGRRAVGGPARHLHLPVDLGWRLAFGLGAVLGIAIALVRRFVPESPRWMMIHGRAEEAERLVAGSRTGCAGTPGRASSRSPTRRSRSASAIDELRRAGRTLFSRYPRRSALGFALMATQAFIYNAVLFTFSIVLVDIFAAMRRPRPCYLVPFALANFLGRCCSGGSSTRSAGGR